MKNAGLLAMLVAGVTSVYCTDAFGDVESCPDANAPKVAFVFEGAQRAPHRHAIRRLAEQLGASACVRTFDHVSSGVDPDANARFLLGSLGLQHYGLVFLLTPRHAGSMSRVVKQFPATTYLQLGGHAQAANLIHYRLDHSTDAPSFYRGIVQCALAGRPLRSTDIGASAGRGGGRKALTACL